MSLATEYRVDTDTITQFISGAEQVPLAQPIIEPEDTVPVSALQDDEPESHEHHTHVDYQIDQAALDASNGDPAVWAKEFAAFIGHGTGTWIDEESIANWFNAYGARIQQFTFRQSAFVVANTTLPAQVTGDPAFLLLQLREDITSAFKKKAGL